MTDALRARVAAVADHVARAHDAVDAGDAAAAGWRARAAAEGMLLVLAHVHDVDVPGGPGRPATLEVLRKALRHANVLERRLEDQVAYVQAIGNRAAHAQHDADLAVDLEEAHSAVRAMDRLHAAWLARLPDALHPDRATALAQAAAAFAPESPTPWRGHLLLAAGVLVGPAVAFLVVTQGLAAWSPSATPDTDDAPLVLPDDDGTFAETDRPYPPLVDIVREGRPVDLSDTERDCDDLTRARAWIWARHAYVFATPDGRALVEDHPHYVGDPTRDRRDVERRFTDIDRANLDRLSAAMDAASCTCPRPLKRRAPCPE